MTRPARIGTSEDAAAVGRAGAAWILGASMGTAALTRIAVALPTWAWVSGALSLGVVGTSMVSPLALASLLAIGKQAQPLNFLVIVVSLLAGIVAMARGGWRRVPRVAGVLFALFALLALPTVRLETAPWEQIRTFFVPGTDWQIVPVPSYEVFAALSFVSTAGLALAVGHAVRSRAQLETFMWAVLAGAAIPILTGIKDRVTGNVSYHDGSPSIEATFGHPNAFATYLVCVAPILIAYAVSARSERARRASGVLGALAVVCLFLTFTRSAWIALVIGAIVVAVVAGRIRQLGVAGLVVAVLVVATGHTSDVTDRFSNVSITTQQTGAKGDSWQWRLVTWSRMWDAYPHSGLTGFGYGAYPRMTVTEFGQVGGRIATNLTSDWRAGFGAHNDYLGVLLMLGLPGLIVWAGFLLALLATAMSLWRRFREPVALGVVASMTAVIVMSFTDNVQAYEFGPLILIGVLTAYYAVLRRPVETPDAADA